MVSIYKTEKTQGNYIMTELRGLSTDEKPVMFEENIIDNGSTYTEIDTGDVYMYDLESEDWFKISGEGGGGGDVKKFDYIIATIDLDMMSSGDEIEDTNILDVLNEIQSFMSSRLEAVTVGLYYIDSDGNDGFAICNAMQYQYVLERLYFITNNYTIYLAYSNDKWYLYKV